MKKILKYSITSARNIYRTYYPEPSFLVPGMIPAKGLTILAGPYKGCKSWFLLHLCVVLSLSGKFLGIFTLQKHKGLYLALEDSESRIHNRMHRLGVEPGEDFIIITF